MAYGGLRGAVGFSLVLGIDKQQVRTTEEKTAFRNPPPPHP
jgi:hypothetical protein